VLTEDTHRLISGLFVVEARGALALKGIERRLQLYRVIQPSGVRGRLEAAAARGLTAFVGREDELRSLMNRWERVLDGEGQVALIIGEAGIGKSRLVQRFHEQIAATPHTWIETAAGAFFQNTHSVAEEDLQRALRVLADAELLYVRGIAPDATYQFKHALIRDAAYKALLKSRRKDLHRLVAHTISEKFAALEETQPEVLARHWTEAGETEQAIPNGRGLVKRRRRATPSRRRWKVIGRRPSS
jgi:predicted ATPase